MSASAEHQMLPTHERRQIAREILGGIGNIFDSPHALHRTERLDPLVDVRVRAIRENSLKMSGVFG